MAFSREHKPSKVIGVEASETGEAEGLVRSANQTGLEATVTAETDERDNPLAYKSGYRADSIENFFELIIEELGSLRTRAKVEAIERAADIILEAEALGGRVHVTGIGKSEHIARYVVGSKDDLKPGAPFRIQTAAKQPDGTYTATSISVGKDGGRPF